MIRVRYIKICIYRRTQNTRHLLPTGRMFSEADFFPEFGRGAGGGGTPKAKAVALEKSREIYFGKANYFWPWARRSASAPSLVVYREEASPASHFIRGGRALWRAIWWLRCWIPSVPSGSAPTVDSRSSSHNSAIHPNTRHSTS